MTTVNMAVSCMFAARPACITLYHTAGITALLSNMPGSVAALPMQSSEFTSISKQLIDHQYIPQQALYWQVSGYKRGPGRPRANWRGVVNKDLRKMGFTWEEAEVAALDRHWMASECGPICPEACFLLFSY